MPSFQCIRIEPSAATSRILASFVAALGLLMSAVVPALSQPATPAETIPMVGIEIERAPL